MTAAIYMRRPKTIDAFHIEGAVSDESEKIERWAQRHAGGARVTQRSYGGSELTWTKYTFKGYQDYWVPLEDGTYIIWNGKEFKAMPEGEFTMKYGKVD